PPPNVTAALHLGHAFNNALQDILVRYHRMRGRLTLWMPGTDHAGIATQTVVEKRLLQQENRRRTDFERDEFVARVQSWKDEYEATITAQLQAIGCSCDWARQRFTMDDVCAAAVREAFFRLFADGLIERGKRLVNWDPVTRTALADDEVEMQETAGKMYYLRYPVEPAAGADPDAPDHVTVATTRPETMLGDTAVAVNPRDPRAAALVGRQVRLPMVDRLIPVIADDYVVLPVGLGGDEGDAKARYATGFLKVTPAHDPNDWEIGIRHGLPVVNVMGPDATVSAEHGWSDTVDDWRSEPVRPLLGLSREDARDAVVAWFDEQGLLEEIREYAHSVGHSYRSHVPIEPYLSDQWYVRVTDDRLVGEAQRALDPAQYEGAAPPRTAGGGLDGDGGLTFYPSRYARSYQAWHDNLRDWCISRQLWWGHRIPVWSLPEPDAAVIERWRAVAAEHPDHVAVQVSATDLHVCLGRHAGELVARAENDGLVQDADVLDTWFSSALWPISTMGWPDPAEFPETRGLLETFNPSTVLVTARDIITLWVSRMVMFNRYFRGGALPFGHVYINPMIQDGHGQRMSKSLGNGVDPRDIIHSHGADALRFTLAKMATSTQDCRMPVDMVCPHCGTVVHPAEITSPAGYRVAAAEQECSGCRRPMVSAYGAASGAADVTDDAPLARNTSPKFDEGRNFANKLWNAARFALAQLSADAAPGGDDPGPSLVDRWILTRLHRTLHVVDDAVAAYQFDVYARAMYEFVWGDFCDWYLEVIKPTVRGRPAQRRVLRAVLDAILRMLHPVCPFVTEALWPHVRETGPADLDGVTLPDHELLAAAAWPRIACRIDDPEALAAFERLQVLAQSIQQVRSQYQVPPKRRIRLLVPAELEAIVVAGDGVVETWARLASVGTMAAERPADAVSIPFEGGEVLVTDLVDEVDVAAERSRLEKLAAEKRKAVEGFERKLANPGYVSKAPPEVVEESRRRLEQAQADLAAAERALQSLARPD
ncbi:MAG: valine--tRNA ligase, partial [Planctomycetota bacterium]